MENRCFACMNPIASEVCPHCGHAQTNGGTDPRFLMPGTIVKDRYYIGLHLDQNGEGVTYLAYDQKENCKVRVREFFPENLCHREGDHKTVTVNSSYEIQYKALMADFVELCKQLLEITANCSVLRAKDILADNGTIYTVYEDVSGVTLTQYLRENAGELSWEETENLFLPLLYTVKVLNSKGIVHRGISPETIIVTKQHELKLAGICTSAVRAINSEITPELFAGYTAPEQYQKCTSHGEWTDVYSISAVLYKTLTGAMPPRADSREYGDSITRPRELNHSIPRSVSEAIVKGLAYEKEERTRYIKDLIGDLYTQRQAVPTVNVHQEMPVEHKSKFKLPVWLIVVLVTLPIMLILFFLVYSTVLGPRNDPSSEMTSSMLSSGETSSEESSGQSSSEPVSSELASFVVDDFAGLYYEDIVSAEFYTNKFKFLPKIEEYDETAPIGEVIKQDIAKNEVVKLGQEIQLTVSKGKQFITLPPFTDASGNPIAPDAYKTYLTDNGLKVKIEYITTENTPSGQIDSLSHSGELTIDREKVSEIIIFVAN